MFLRILNILYIRGGGLATRLQLRDVGMYISAVGKANSGTERMAGFQ